MKVYELINILPLDHCVKIYFSSTGRTIDFLSIIDLWSKAKGITYDEKNDSVDYIYADGFKGFYITTF